jgi:hypothetical protein
MDDIVLIQYGENPESFLIEQLPGMVLAKVGFGESQWWILLAVGAPMFSLEEEQHAQQLMRRYGLDAQRFQEPHQAAVALHKALEKEAQG